MQNTSFKTQMRTLCMNQVCIFVCATISGKNLLICSYFLFFLLPMAEEDKQVGLLYSIYYNCPLFVIFILVNLLRNLIINSEL